jgi:hypothetical protein
VKEEAERRERNCHRSRHAPRQGKRVLLLGRYSVSAPSNDPTKIPRQA